MAMGNYGIGDTIVPHCHEALRALHHASGARIRGWNWAEGDEFRPTADL